MQVDTEYLRQQYAALSDEALLEINRADLVEAARKCYDEELQRRQLSSTANRSMRDRAPDGRAAHRAEYSNDEHRPDWFEEGAEVYSETIFPGASSGAEAASEAADVLRAAGIPCYLEMCEIPREQQSAFPPPTHRWRLLVPGKLNLRATSVLDEEIFNPELETEWKAHLESMSDGELSEMNPQIVYSGLFDRLERLTKAYEEEVLRRGLS